MDEYTKTLLELEELHERKSIFTSYFLKMTKKESSIDEGTFKDLMMDNVYLKLFCPYLRTSLGEQILYSNIRNPLTNKEELEKRRDKISKLKSFNMKNRFIKILDDIGTIGYYNFTDIIFNKPKRSTTVSIMSKISLICTILAVALYFVNPFLLFLIAFSVLSYPLFSGKFFDDNNDTIVLIKYLAKVISGAEDLANVNAPEFADDLKRIQEIHKKFSLIPPLSKWLGTPHKQSAIVITLDTLFGTRYFAYNIIANILERNNKELIELVEIIGELDSNLAIDEIEENNYVCSPNFTDKKTFACEDLYNPLIDNCVANSLTIKDHGLILTGSNMAGKSTFLRSIGINVILSQTVGIAFAKKYEAPILNILTSISRNDNMLAGKSYYLEEAQAVQTIVQNCNNELPILCIIDEIFKGTNPTERVAAAASICNYLSKSNCIPIVATHDMELTSMVKNYSFYYFSETINKDKSMTFDYKLKKGLCPSSNAVKILEILNYPKEIIDDTYKRLKK